MEFLSASKLKKFRKCPFSLQEEYKTNPAVNFGSAVHEGLAAFFKDGSFEKAFARKAKELEVENRASEAMESFKFVQGLNIDKEAIITVESEDGEASYYGKHFFEIEFSKKWGIRGAMDLVFVDANGGLNIIDWKTGQSKEEDDLQLAIYALCAWKKYGSFPTIKTTFAYVQQNFLQSSSWDAESLVSALSYLENLAKDYIEETSKPKLQWRQTPHKNCKYCSLKDNCAAYQKQLEVMPEKVEIAAVPENLPKILTAIEKLEAIKKAAEAYSEELKEIQLQVIEGAGGKINYDGRTFQVKEKVSRYDYNLDAIFTEVEKLIGRKPLEICSYSSTGAKELAKELDKEQKTVLDEIINANREVKSKSKSVSVSISKEPIEETE